jgi:hypothetical protein
MIAALALAPAGCKRKKKRAADDEPAGLATMLSAADSRRAAQFIRGVYSVEQDAWRWTSGDFAVMLKPPTGASAKGATLQLKFVLPDVSINKLQSITVAAAVEGQKLPPETYTKAGEYTYARDVPASVFRSDAVTAEFKLDKTLPPNDQDIRELGVILQMVGFEAKP